MAFIRKKPVASVSPEDALAGAQATAEWLLEKAGQLGLSLRPLDVQALAQSFGIKTTRLPLSGERSCVLKHTDHEGWAIEVNALYHPTRQRFAIAHQLGHYFLHRTQQAQFETREFFHQAPETGMHAEANLFALRLLMPEADFRAQRDRLDGSIEGMAKHFQVSSLAVRFRAKSLGMKAVEA